jgi:hypothetical protein
MAPMLSHAVDPMTDCGFNQATPHPADPIECHRARREHRNPKAVHQCSGLERPPLDLLENSIGHKRTTTWSSSRPIHCYSEIYPSDRCSFLSSCSLSA